MVLGFYVAYEEGLFHKRENHSDLADVVNMANGYQELLTQLRRKQEELGKNTTRKRKHELSSLKVGCRIVSVKCARTIGRVMLKVARTFECAEANEGGHPEAIINNFR